MRLAACFESEFGCCVWLPALSLSLVVAFGCLLCVGGRMLLAQWAAAVALRNLPSPAVSAVLTSDMVNYIIRLL